MVTDKQVRRLFALIKTEQNQEIAASKAGMDAKTARKYRRHGGLPSELPTAVRGRTRPDPFIDVWDDVQKLVEDNAGLEAKTVFEFLQRQNPGRFQDGQVRTLQRRVKVWRATEGPAREVFFAQQHPPGRLGASRDRLIWVLDIANALAELHEPELNQASTITTHQGAEQP